MRHLNIRWLALSILVSTWLPAVSLGDQTSGAEIDRTVWEVIARSVVEQDIEAMASTYHPDAVLVSGRGTSRIADQLVVWGRGMQDQKATGAAATVAFRFSQRLDGEETAFEAGIFNYTVIDSEGDEIPSYVPFEALLVRKDGIWLMVMERQLPAVDESAWEALDPSRPDPSEGDPGS